MRRATFDDDATYVELFEICTSTIQAGLEAAGKRWPKESAAHVLEILCSVTVRTYVQLRLAQGVSKEKLRKDVPIIHESIQQSIDLELE